MDDRVERLEVKVAFQEHELAQLDEVIQRLHAELDELRREIGTVKAQVDKLEPSPENAKPPHY